MVQREAKNKDRKGFEPDQALEMALKDNVQKGGGKVGKQLGIIASFAAEMSGKEIEKLAKNHKVSWISPDAPMISTGTGGLSTVLDRFDQQIYTGSEGTETWSNGWIEGTLQNGDAEVSTPGTGVFLVANSSYCAEGDGYCLRMDPYWEGSYVYRQVDLSGAGKCHAVTLSKQSPLSGLWGGGIANLRRWWCHLDNAAELLERNLHGQRYGHISISQISPARTLRFVFT